MPARVLAACLCGAAILGASCDWSSARAQQPRVPVARVVSAPRLVVPGAVDSNVPMVWDVVDGQPRLFAVASFAGTPALLTGTSLGEMRDEGPVNITSHPGDGVWIESVIPDEGGAWYGYYHHETPAHACGRADRFVPRIGALKSVDRGRTWEHLGIILDAPPDSVACDSSNRYVLGGVGDVSVLRGADGLDVFLYYTQYSRVPSEQGVAVARLAWADRDAPIGKLTVWSNGAWLPDTSTGTPLVPPSRPWHDGQASSDAFWGPSIHWNEYLEQYVMLLNRARDEQFNNEGIFISYARTLDDPRGWTAPQKIMNRGGWYPQVAGLEPGSGTDKQAGRRARFLLTGRSDYYIEFER